jgi:phage-related protein
MGLEEVGAKLVLEGESQFTSSMKRAEDQSSGFGRTLSKVADGIAQGFGQALFGAVSKGIGAIPGLLEDAVKTTMEWGQSLDSIGDVLGTTTEQSAGLASMFKTIGGSTEQLTGAMAKMTAGLLDAKGDLGPTGTALKGLGIEFRGAKGKMLPATDIFQMVADKIGNMPDGLEKTSLMMDIFGKSGKEMGDALGAAANGGMNAYIDQAKAMGLAIDPEQVIENQKAWETMKLVFMGLSVQLGTALLPAIMWVSKEITALASNPAIKEWITSFTGYITQAVSWVKEQWPIISQTFVTVFGQVQSSIGFVQGIIKSFLDIVQGWWKQNGEAITGTVNSMWDRVKGLFDAASRFIQALIGAALKVIEAFWQTHGNTIMGIVQWLWDTVQAIFNTAISILTSIFQAFTDALEGDWEGFKTNLLTAWDTLWTLIKSAAVTAWDALSNWLSGVMKEIIAKFNNTDWGQIGRNIMDGIGNALRNGWNYLTTLVSNLANELFEAAKKALGIASPSRLFEGIGINMMLGMGKGISEGSAVPIQATQQAAMSSAASVSAGPSNYQYSYATNYNLNLSTQQTSQNVQQSFAIMRMLAG